MLSEACYSIKTKKNNRVCDFNQRNVNSKRIYVEVVQIVVVFFKCFKLCFSWLLEDVLSFNQKTLLQVFRESQTFKGNS